MTIPTAPTTAERFETMKTFIADRVKRLKAAFPEYKNEGGKIVPYAEQIPEEQS